MLPVRPSVSPFPSARRLGADIAASYTRLCLRDPVSTMGDVGFSPAEERQVSTDPGVAFMKLNCLREPPERLGAEDLEQMPDWAREEYKARLRR